MNSIRRIIRTIVFLLCAVCGLSSQPTTDHPRSLEQSIRSMYLAGHYRAIIDTLREYSLDSLTGATLTLLGESQVAFQEIEEAARAFSTLLRRDSSSVSVRFQLARLLSQAGKGREALQEYESLLRIDSTYTPGLISSGDLLSDRRSFGEASRRYHRALMKNPRNARLNYLVGRSLVQLERQDSAVGYLAVALTLQRDHLPSLVLLASIHYGKGRFEDAARLYRSALIQEPDNAEYLLSLGLCRLKLKDPVGAKGILQKASSRDPGNTVIMAVLGQALFELERYDSAAVVYRAAATLDPDNPSLWLNLALTLGRMDSISSATPAMRKAIAAYQPEQIAYAYRQLGALLFNGKKFTEALTAYERALLLLPSDLDSRFFYAATLDQLGRGQAAHTAYRRYLAIVPDTPEHRRHVSVARARVKDLSTPSRTH